MATSNRFVASLGVVGLTKADLSLRVYVDGAPVAASVLDAVTVTHAGDGDYVIANLPPPGAGRWYTVTYEYPTGVGFHYHYNTPSTGAPSSLIIPVRETGLVLADFDFALYKDEVQQVASLTVVEVGTPGDYRVSGWSTLQSGRWVLVWRRGGVSFFTAWTVAPSYPSASIIPALLDMFPDDLTAQPGATDGYGAWVASGAAVVVPCYVQGGNRLVRAANGREVVSGVRVVTAGAFDFTVDSHRYTLPTRFNDSIDVEAIAVDSISDEAGPHHEVVMFP